MFLRYYSACTPFEGSKETILAILELARFLDITTIGGGCDFRLINTFSSDPFFQYAIAGIGYNNTMARFASQKIRLMGMPPIPEECLSI
jgi:hypothetical protein